MDKRYEEKKDLLKLWEELKISKFNKNIEDSRKLYIIDTPPPYPSGDLHLGNALNWCWIDIFARYKRMKGFDVLFPQGWDVHGLPTEVKVEKAHNIKSEQVERGKWKQMCIDWTEENIRKIKENMKKLGLSIDWDYEFRTSDDNYKKLIQLSFLDLYRKGLAYRGKYPISFCTTCRTAIADAEVEYKDTQTKLNYILFKIKGEDKEVEIATTRPELIPSCVAIGVNPEDEKNKELIGKKLIVPIFRREVEVLPLNEVDPKFGTGVVMICSFGDKQDVDWILNNNLPIVESINENGKMVVEPYKGLNVEEAREKIILDLKEQGKLVKQEEIRQSRGTCWRCHKPVEILRREQWFIAVNKFKDQVIEETDKVNWIPKYMKHRQIDWTNNMNRDWCVSRKKIFGTPIPVWYCEKCSKIVVAKEEDLPVDPAEFNEKYQKCECGGKLVGEKETLDTWMDSSFSIAFVSNYLEPIYNKEEKKFDKFYKADLQPNGMDIIRTWDYYLMVRHLMAFNKPPYKNCLINGMVLGKDGKKMSKSLGNIVTFEEAVNKYNSDVVRYWTYLTTPGSNIIPSDQNFKRGTYLLTKLWNSARFCESFIRNFNPREKENLQVIDEWILTKLSDKIEKIEEHLNNYEAAKALAELEHFFVHDFCDNYLEFVKYRLYNNIHAEAAKYTLYKIIFEVTKMFAPFLPYISESIYQELFKERESVHLENFPDFRFNNEKSYKLGELLTNIISEVRKWKISNKISLGKEIFKVEINRGDYLLEDLDIIKQDIQKISRAREIEFREGKFHINCVKHEE
jgi:valyl-tRNA synthetase